MVSRDENLHINTVETRYLRLRGAVEEIRQRSDMIRPPFSIAAYGSTAYGISAKLDSEFKDLDIIAVVNRGLVFKDTIGQLAEIFQNGFDDHSGLVDIQRLFVEQREVAAFRLAGQISGEVPFSIHCFASDCLENLTQNAMYYPVALLMPNKSKYTSKRYMEKVLGNDTIMQFPLQYKTIDDSKIIALQYFLRKNISSYSLGILIEKFLTTEEIWDQDSTSIIAIRERLISALINLLDLQMELEEEYDLSSLFVRGYRFSTQFIRNLRIQFNQQLHVVQSANKYTLFIS